MSAWSMTRTERWVCAIFMLLPIGAAVALIWALLLFANTLCNARDAYLQEHPDSGWQRCQR